MSPDLSWLRRDPRKLFDVIRLRALDWKPSISLRVGNQQTYDWYREHGPAA